MVQFTDSDSGVVVSEPAPFAGYPQPHIASMEQIPFTMLAGPGHPVTTHQQFFSDPSANAQLQVPPQFFPQDSGSEVTYSALSSYPDQPQVGSSDGYQHTEEFAFTSGDKDRNLASTGHFTAFGSVDNIPTTSLDSGYVTPEKSSGSTEDVSSDLTRSFTVVPVGEGEGYGEVDNSGIQQKDSYALDNTQSTDGALQVETRADSVDSLIKGYASDSSSDVYMNSDYTDTVTSTDFLLPLSKTEDHNDNTDVTREPTTAEESTITTNNCYSNDAFSDASKELITWSSEESVEDKVEGGGKAAGIEWVITMPEEDDSGAMADKEDDEEDCENRELVPLQYASGLENLVNQLAEQHPEEVVDISVEVLDGPVYESLTEPLPEGGWLQSTESLHMYKLLKQGRFSASNSLRIQAVVNNLRAKTMDNIHERNSFLNLTAASVTNLGRACQKALNYVRTDMEFGSMMSMKDSLKQPGQGQPPSDMEALNSAFSKKMEPSVASGRHTRNVLYMSLLVTILLISVNATRNLQSSLNQEGGVGITCLAVMFASYMLGSLLSPVLVQGVGVKSCITGGLVLQLVYVAANLYPVMWVMVPASLGGGASLALIWNAMSTYLVLLARGEANYKQKSYERVSDKYFGFFCLIYQSNLIVGNLIASLVLTFGDGPEADAILPLNFTAVNLTTSFHAATNELSPVQVAGADLLGMLVGGESSSPVNSSSLAFNASTDSHYSLCGSEYCHHFVINQESSSVSARTIYLLFGIFMFLVVVTILIAVFLLEPLSPHLFSSTPAPWSNVKRQFVSLVKFSRNVKFLLLLPLLLYSSMQFTFVCSEVMMAYVTCPAGVWLVGYTMMAYGVCCSVSSYITQAFVPRTGRGFFIGLVLEKIKVLV
ncbi:uncharacterized protein [Littorina saxatilis]|uniref:uncharacterized protein isoform X2 n=1 Tax=Littorina saxatilis TaxID=31220 RepID=UPI0038B45BF0